MQDELARPQPAAQPAFHQQVLERHDIHLARIEAEGVAACLLGFVHGGVGIAQQDPEILAVDRIDADAQRRRNRQIVAAHRKRRHADFDQARCDFGGARDLDAGQGHDELVAAETGQGVDLAHHRRQALRHRAQQFVAGAVPERVVDPLEMIEVDEDQRHLRPVALGRRQQLRAAIAQQATVRQTGQRVEVGEFANPHFRFLLRRDVEHGAYRRRPPFIGRRRTEDNDREPGFVLAHAGEFVGCARFAGGPLPHLFPNHGALLGNDQVERPAPAHQFLLGVTEERHQERVHITKNVVLEHEDSDLRGFHRRPELRLLFPYGQLGRDALADIDGNAQCRKRLAVTANLERHRVMTMSHLALGIAHAIVDSQRYALPRTPCRNFRYARHDCFEIAGQHVVPKKREPCVAHRFDIQTEQLGRRI